MNREKTIKLLKEYDNAYYNDAESVITDAEYDMLKETARAEFPSDPYFKTVGASPAGAWPVEKHTVPMGSIDNVPVDRDIWIPSLLANTRTWWEGIGRRVVLVQPKFDGVSLGLEYIDKEDHAELHKAILRGDGKEGENIIANARHFQNMALLMQMPKGTKFVRGEVLMYKENLVLLNAQLDKPYSSCRAAAAGISRRKDGLFSEQLTFQPFEVIGSDLTQLICRPMTAACTTFAEIEKAFNHLQIMRATLPYIIDGVVVKAQTEMRAMKFPPEQQEFIVDDVRWFIGKTGKFTPVAHNDKGVQFFGKIVHEVTLHNFKAFNEYELGLRDVISVSISMDVIPKIEAVLLHSLNKKFQAPVFCPVCEAALMRDETNLICPRTECLGRKKALALAHAEEMGIDALGPGVIEKLFEYRKIKDFSDLYELKLEQIANLPGMGELSAQKVITNIRSAMNPTLAQFVAGLGIPGVGCRTIEKIGVGTLNDLYKLTVEDLTKIEGIGQHTATALVYGLVGTKTQAAHLLMAGVVIRASGAVSVLENRLQGRSYCFTGDVGCVNPQTRRPYTREECQKIVQQYGGTIKSGVSKKLDVLVLADMKSDSTKARKARELGIELISADDFFKGIK